MKKEYILVIDSGIGGLSTLCEIYKVLPANFIYFADNKNAPYGKHKKEDVYNFLEKIISSVCLKFKVSMVVLACNTATTTSIEKLRDKFTGIKFIGTEPAIKLAGGFGNKKILSVATPTTIKSNKYKYLKSSINVYVENLPLNSFAPSIEKYFVSRSVYASFVMQKNIYKIAHASKNFDCICLGCTHYVFTKNLIEKICKKSAFDGNLGVAKQVLFWHEKLSLVPNQKPNVKFIISDSQKTSKEIYKKIFYEILAKV